MSGSGRRGVFVHFTSKGTACRFTGCAGELGAQGECMPTGGDQPRRSPAHAGRLRPWERLTIGLVLVLIAAIVVALSISDVHTHSAGPRAREKTTPAVERLALGSGWGSAVLTGPGSIPFPSAVQFYWGLTSTTVDDQLRLLADLTSRNSPLSAQSRFYELGLMRHVAADQGWGGRRGRHTGNLASRQERLAPRREPHHMGDRQHRRDLRRRPRDPRSGPVQ
jgi:hypothetical protein